MRVVPSRRRGGTNALPAIQTRGDVSVFSADEMKARTHAYGIVGSFIVNLIIVNLFSNSFDVSESV